MKIDDPIAFPWTCAMMFHGTEVRYTDFAVWKNEIMATAWANYVNENYRRQLRAVPLPITGVF